MFQAALAGAGCFVAVVVVAIARIPIPVDPIVIEASRFDTAWTDFNQSTVKKTDRIIPLTASKAVVTERIIPDAPVGVPSVIAPAEADKPVVQHRRRIEKRRDTCARHGMRKVQIGKRWRCRK